MFRGLLTRVFARRQPSMANAIVAGMAPLLGDEALAVIVGLIPRHFGLRDLGGAQPIADGAETRQAMADALQQHQPVTPYYVIDLFRRLDLAASDPSGLALFDAALAAELAKAAVARAGKPPQVALSGFDPASIASDRLRYPASAIAANASSIADRWTD
ncbi:hypothetical protein [Blastomonas sp. AAP53]|uniref:hypothetical protein n=1 Tax=Blastomonas sp. AAP53 TaxID=1248760 RepID=UPI0002D9A10B|nr:hypothetical protein [Blastomonas sp. AAP53]